MKKSLSLITVFFLANLAAVAQPERISDAVRAQIQALHAEKLSRTPAQKKLDSQLIIALKQKNNKVLAKGAPVLRTHVQPDQDGLVLVDLDANADKALLQQIQAAGGKVIFSSEKFRSVRAALPLEKLEEIAARKDVKFIRSAVRAITNAGTFTSEGDLTHRADAARLNFGVNGTGVKIGVLSDSVDHLQQSQATGDLPPNVTVLPGQSGVPASGEGTAMLEIIHDLAPGAELYFATAFNGSASFAQNILDLRAAGCDIIVDDVGYFNETPFQDTIIAKAVNQVTADGALYFSSAGNSGNENRGTSGTWQGDFNAGGAVTSPADGKGGVLHLFDSTNTYNICTSQGLGTVLFWSDPWGASTNDYDLYILDKNGSTVVGSSTTVQSGLQDPYEEILVPAKSGERIVIVKVSGDARMLHLDTVRGKLSIHTAGNTKGHACATNAFCVAAVYAGNSYPNPFSGGAANPVESFSSDGPRQVFYHSDGTPITPGNYLASGGAIRQKPDIAAADGVATSMLSFRPFYGTSAAAPHAGAIAALVKSANPWLLASDIRNLLTSTALDIQGVGVDRDSGAGLVMAYQALQAAPKIPVLLLETNFISGGNGNGVIDPQECDDLTIVLTNRSGYGASGISATLSCTNDGILIVKPTSTYPDIPGLTNAANRLPFRISVAPSFIVGTTIDLTLLVKTDQGSWTNSFRLNTGTPGTPIRFENSNPVAIPDSSLVGTNSLITVTNITNAITKVTASVYITHTYDYDLRLQLIAPDGTTAMLVTNRGGLGQNFGAGCGSDNARTLFDDDAQTFIANGIAPFIGSFKPEERLAVFSGKFGTNVNGTWQLKVVDTIPQDTGILQCWALNITPTISSEGDGECPGVDLSVAMKQRPEPVVLSSNLTYSITVSNAGPSTTKGVILNHALPAGATLLSVTTSQGSWRLSGNSVVCTLGTMAAKATASINVVVVPNQFGTFTTTASVGSPDNDYNLANNTVILQTTVLAPLADLGITMVDSPDPVLGGGVLTYTLQITNNGPFNATGVILTNILPNSCTLLSKSTSQGAITTGGNTVLTSLGTVPAHAGATVILSVLPSTVGTITAMGQITADQTDPFPANNKVVVTTTVNPAADVSVSVVASPSPAIAGGPLTYTTTVTNRGPSTANDVRLTQSIPGVLRVVSVATTQGSVTNLTGSVNAAIGTLLPGASCVVTIATTTTNLPTIAVSTAQITRAEVDPNATNDVFTLSTTIAQPRAVISPAGAKLVLESLSPANSAIDPGETVVLELLLQNTGNIPSTNSVATLLATGGVSAPSAPQSYGALAPGALPVARLFSFTAAGTNGGTVTATLLVQDGTASSYVTFSFALPLVTTVSNTNLITIPSKGAASPYPATLTVSNLPSAVSRVTATLSGFQHTYPKDVSVLLVSPTGQKSLLMSHAGDAPSLNANLTFDDAASIQLPELGSLSSGTFKNAAFGDAVEFPTNTPAGPFTTNMGIFNAANPNGTWSLYAYDETTGDFGRISNGWSLSFVTLTPVNKVADLAASAAVATNQVMVGDTVTFSFTLQNNGPDLASNVQITNQLPAGLDLLSCSLAQYTAAGQTITANLGNIPAGTNVTFRVTALVTAPGNFTASIIARATEVDLNDVNDQASVAIAAVLPPADLALGVSASSASVVVGHQLTYTFSVTNFGPNTARNVVLTNPLPYFVQLISAGASQGSWTMITNYVMVYRLGDIPVGGVVTASLVIEPFRPGTLVDNAQVVSLFCVDPNPVDNSVTTITTASAPFASIVPGAARLLSENGFRNGAVDPGETVSVSLGLVNSGTAPTAQLVATLLAAGGVAPTTLTQDYGAIAPGASVSRTFDFVASASPGSEIIAQLSLNDGTSSLGTVTFTFGVPKTTAFGNSDDIRIPDIGAANPYPSVINVAGLKGVVSSVSVTLSNLSHTYPRDIHAMLVGPQGQRTVLMGSVGGAFAVTNLTLTINDTASTPLPSNSVLTAGTYAPADYSAGYSFPGFSGVPVISKNIFNGTEPNGNWSLYLADDHMGDPGRLAGWSLLLTTAETVNPAADVALQLQAPAQVLTGNHLTYNLVVNNKGPSIAENVVLTDLLPAGVTYVSASASQGTVSNLAGVLTCNLGSLPVGSSASIALTIRPGAVGSYRNSASLLTDSTDLHQENNNAIVSTLVLEPASAWLSVVRFENNGLLQGILRGQAGVSYAIQRSTNLTSWTAVSTNVLSDLGNATFYDLSATNLVQFYRAVRLP